MKKMGWKLLVPVLALVCLAALLPVGASAQGSGWEVSGSRINPLYNHLASGWEPRSTWQPGFGARTDPDLTYQDEAASAAILREAMVDRLDGVRLGVRTKEGDFDKVFDTLWNLALQETGVPKEGDYLIHHLHGLNVEGYANMDGNGNYYYTLQLAPVYLSNAEQERAVDAAVETLLEELALDGLTDYRKIEKIYAWLCDNVTYDYAGLEAGWDNTIYTAYAALIRKTAVCQGYASLFYRLARESGVAVRVVDGLSSGGAHAWNIVGLGGKWFNLDATWDAGLSDWYFFLRCPENFDNHERNAAFETAQFHAEHSMCGWDYQDSQGSCGKNIRWELDLQTGVLSLIGTGATENFLRGQAPWAPYVQQITQVAVGEGITALGDGAFYGCDALAGITLPDSLEKLGDYAFEGCTALKAVQIPASVTGIGEGCFRSSDGVVIYSWGDTCAQRYALEKGIPFVDIAGIVQPGDANGDGVVDSKDRTLLARYLAGWADYSVEPDGADVNADGTVNGKDRAILARHLAGWEDYKILPAA